VSLERDHHDGHRRPDLAAQPHDPPRSSRPRPTTAPIKLSDYKGKWVVLFSHPGRLHARVPTEFVRLGPKQADFRQGAASSHRCDHRQRPTVPPRVIQSVAKNFVCVKINVPGHRRTSIRGSAQADRLIQSRREHHVDRSLRLPSSNPNQTLRAMVYYPLTTGRSIDEIIRVIDAAYLTREASHGAGQLESPSQVIVRPAHQPRPPRAPQGAGQGGVRGEDWYLTDTLPEFFSRDPQKPLLSPVAVIEPGKTHCVTLRSRIERPGFSAGGESSVFRATDLRLGRAVAIKVLYYGRDAGEQGGASTIASAQPPSS